MTNLEFIEKAFYGNTTKNSHNSLFKDSNNNIYSYGYHYPLLFTADDNDKLVFVNTTGYSNTTSKHIGHAKKALDYKYIGIKLEGRRLNPSFTLADALNVLLLERDVIELDMSKKKRKDTQVYKWLATDLARVNAYIEEVKAAM